MPDKIQNRRDTLSNWTSKNPVLTSGEIGYITDTNEFVIGNGTDTFSTLKRFRDESLLQEHIGSTDGHPIATQSANGFLSSTDKAAIDNHIGSTDGHPTATVSYTHLTLPTNREV